MDMDMERLKKLNEEDGFIRHNGIRVTALERGECECRAELTREGMNPHGIAHGGMLFAMCDTVAGVAGTTLGHKVVTRSASVYFLRPGAVGTLIARGRIVHRGRHTALCEAEVYGEGERLLMRASFDMAFIDEKQGEDR